MKNINNLSLPLTILLASFVLGFFYYLAEVNKQNSIKKQKDAEISVEMQNNARLEEEKKDIGECATRSARIAVEMATEDCNRNTRMCIGASQYREDQYQVVFNTCIQSKGLKN